MVDQVKVAADEQAPAEQSRRTVDHFCVYDHRFYAFFRDARHGGIAALESGI